MTTTATDPSISQDIDDYREERSCGTYWFLFVTSLVLICFIPSEAAWVSTSRGWYTQPMIGSLLGLFVLCMFSFVRVAPSLKDFRNSAIGRGENTVDALFEKIDSFRTAIIASALFFVYIETLDVIGFTLATLFFVTTLLWMSRLLNRIWFVSSVLTVAALLIIFRVVLHIWLPDVWLYSHLPDQLADFANQYL